MNHQSEKKKKKEEKRDYYFKKIDAELAPKSEFPSRPPSLVTVIKSPYKEKKKIPSITHSKLILKWSLLFAGRAEIHWAN